MSELFRWLKKTQKESKRPSLAQALDVAEVCEETPQVPVSEEPLLVDSVPDSKTFNLELADPRIKTVLDPRTLAGEQFRFLRTRLGHMKQQRGLKCLLVTSSLPEEGKTFAACCLAGLLAQEQGSRILLADADLRRPKAALNLGIDEFGQPGGLAGILQGKISFQSALLRLPNMDLFFLPAGPDPGNASELLASKNLDRVIKQMTELFDWVIVDSPPVLTLADPSRLAPLCDSVLMVVHANKTPTKLVNRAIQMIGKDRICGILLNRVQHLRASGYQYSHYAAG